MEKTTSAAQDVEAPEKRRRRRRAIVWLALVALILLLLTRCWHDPRARRGHYEGKTDEEVRADLDAEVAWNAMAISVASQIEVAEGETRVEARIENLEANHCDQRVRVYEATRPDDVLFSSGAISPGEYLQWIELAHPLALGTHHVVVEFQGYETTPSLFSDEGIVLGHDRFGASCAAEVTIEVLPA